MADLTFQIRTCTLCPLGNPREGIAVPAEVGRNYGELGFILEGPGRQEAATGRPLMGPSGAVFNRILEDAGLQRSDVLIMNRVRCRPPDNRVPGANEIAACDPWTHKEIEAYNPLVLVTMGATAMSLAFPGMSVSKNQGVSRFTSEDFSYGSRLWVCTFHPAAALPHRRPELYDVIVEDVIYANQMAKARRQEQAQDEDARREPA